MCASVSCFTILCQGDTAMDTLRQWQRTYSRELDQDTKQECIATERLLRKALAGGGELLTSSQPFSLGLPFKYPFTLFFSPTYLCLTQFLLLRPQPSLSMPCRTASCLMLKTQSRFRPLEGAVPPAKAGLGPTGTQRWRQYLPAPNGGRATAQHSDTEPEEHRLLFSMG